MRLLPRILFVILLLTSLRSFATPVGYYNVILGSSGGTLSGTSALSLNGSTLVSIWNYGYGTLSAPDLGSVTFTTPPLAGSLQLGGTFGSGGSITITSNGCCGLQEGVIFSATFTSGTWTLSTTDGIHTYTFTGYVMEYESDGLPIPGVTQFTVSTGTGYFSGSVGLTSENTSLRVTPEPSSLGLLVTGLVALAGRFTRGQN